MARLVVLGAGPMGLATAYYGLQAGYQVDVLEASDRPGGMAAHFDFGGLSIERFYHFACKGDAPTFQLMKELGIGDLIRWRPTSMGYYTEGRLHRWGDPIALLRFPNLDLLSKLRYGAQMFLSTKRSDWGPLDRLSAREWLVSGSGQRAYDVLWKRLMELKFYEFADEISAAWLWSRIKRLGNSRRSLMQEELGYIEGGTETLVNALVRGIAAAGGRLHLSTPASRIEVAENGVCGVLARDRRFVADQVIATIPIPQVVPLVSDLPDTLRARYAALRNIGVVCVLLKLRRPVSPHFWINISDAEIEVPGLVEFSNLRPLPDTVIYVPYYMPVTNPKFARLDAAFVSESMGYIRQINPKISTDDLLASHVSRLRHAQPICEPGFLDTLPPVQTPIRSLQIADTSYYYPEDRGVAESIRFAKQMVATITGA